MHNASRSHVYEFSFYGQPTLDELIAELQNTAIIMGGTSKVRIKSTDDQRDGYSMSVRITGPVSS